MAFKQLQSALNKACKANGQQTVDAGKNAYANVQASAAQTKQGYNNIKNGVSNVYNNMANAYNGTGQQQAADPTASANAQRKAVAQKQTTQQGQRAAQPRQQQPMQPVKSNQQGLNVQPANAQQVKINESKLIELIKEEARKIIKNKK